MTVVVPSTTGQRMRALIASTGAEVTVSGSVWDEAHATAIELAEQSGRALLHPFDHPDIWEGHASMITEVREAGLSPSLVLVSVGGGGLLCGVLQGMAAARHSRQNPPHQYFPYHPVSSPNTPIPPHIIPPHLFAEN